MYFIWEEDFTTRAFRLEKRILEMDKLMNVEFTLPKSLQGKFPDGLKINITRASPSPLDYFECGAARMVSEDLKEFLQSWPVNEAEFFPVQVLQQNKPAARNYFCFHLIVEVDCIDQGRSEYTTYEGAESEFIYSVQRLVFDESKTNGHAMFRLAKFYRTITCIEESLAAAIRKAGFTGITFIKPDDWRWR